MQNGPRKSIVDAERHRRIPKTLAISVKTIRERMLILCEADSMRNPGTTLASATLAQKVAETHAQNIEKISKFISKSMPGRQQIDQT